MKRKKCDNRGFSLIELIVAVLIIAIISGGAVMAFGSIFSNKTKSAAIAVQDGLKQVRIDALGLENEKIFPQTITVGSESISFVNTYVYAKFYRKNSGIYVDVCSNKTGNSGDESVLHSRKVCDDSYKIDFYWKDADTTPLVTIDNTTSESVAVKIYFKKSTGGISGVEYSASGKRDKFDFIRVTGPGGDTNDVVLVPITGRSYIE